MCTAGAALRHSSIATADVKIRKVLRGGSEFRQAGPNAHAPRFRPEPERGFARRCTDRTLFVVLPAQERHQGFTRMRDMPPEQ